MNTQGLTISPGDPLYKLIVDIPDFYSNPVGSNARAVLVSKMVSCTPGKNPDGKAFLQIFFPNYRNETHTNEVASVTGIKDKSWAELSVSVLCQSMYYQTSNFREELNIDKIEKEGLKPLNDYLRDNVFKWYRYVMYHDFMKYSGDKFHDKNTYISQITSSHWITYKMLMYTSGVWSNPEWELYHHWVKLSALGASDDEIKQVIVTLIKRGLRVPHIVGPDTWQKYTVWYRPNYLYHKDIDDMARPAMLKTLCYYGVCAQEHHCHQFTADDQPGNVFRVSNSSSCFSSNTKVMMSDGSLRKIMDINPRDVVQTPTGPRQVMMVTTPHRGDRLLYGVNGYGFHFTNGHPFANGERDQKGVQPEYLAVSPLKLINDVPLIGYVGVGTLKVGSKLLDSASSPLKVMSIQKYTPNHEGELLYDLILEPSEEIGTFEYIVGDERALFIVASELPITKDKREVTVLAFDIITKMIDNSSSYLEKLFVSFEYDTFLSKLHEIVRGVQQSLMVFSGSLTRHKFGSLEKMVEMKEGISITQSIMASSRIFVTQQMGYNVATGVAFDFLMRKLFSEISSCLELGFRVIPDHAQEDILCVSVLDLQLISSSLSIPQQPNITVEVEGHVSCHLPSEGRLNSFGGWINNIFYVPLNKLKKDSYLVKFNIRSPEDGELIVSASRYIILPIGHLYEYYRLPLFTTDGSELGFINVDVRQLSAVLISIEEENAAGWNQIALHKLANHMEAHGSKLLSMLCQKSIPQS